jgi:hypothetical protein
MRAWTRFGYGLRIEKTFPAARAVGVDGGCLPAVVILEGRLGEKPNFAGCTGKIRVVAGLVLSRALRQRRGTKDQISKKNTNGFERLSSAVVLIALETERVSDGLSVMLKQGGTRIKLAMGTLAALERHGQGRRKLPQGTLYLCAHPGIVPAETPMFHTVFDIFEQDGRSRRSKY